MSKENDLSSKPESGGHEESLGVRRSVELPEADIEAARDLAPASGAVKKNGRDTTTTTTTTDEEAADSGPASREEAGDSQERPADTATPVKEKQEAGQALDVAVATPPDADADTDAGVDGGTPPDRPKKPILAAAAIGGAVVLAIPILLIGMGSHDGKKQRTAAAAEGIMPGDGQQPPPGVFVSSTPSATPSPSASASKKAKPKPGKHAAAKHAAAVPAKAAFTGADNVLLKNAGSKLCADVPGYGNGSADGPVNQYHCALGDADNQVWSLGVMQDLKGPGGAPLFVIRNVKDDYCMDLPYYGAHAAGTKVTEYYCRPTKSDNQLWYRTHTRGHLYRLRNYASHGLCLGVTGRSRAADKQLEIQKCGSGDEWSWPSGA